MLLSLAPTLWAAEAGQPAKPNILFLFADDQRADTIAALGNPVIQTPNLDRLAHSGLAFDRAYMQGGFNAATCVPSRAMLLSGRDLFHSHEHLKQGEAFDDTWPAAFGRAGYTTFMTGKWHNGPASLPHSFQIARSVFAGGMGNPMKLELSDLADGELTPPRVAAKHSIATFADEAIRFLKEQKSGPFFAYVPFDAPHDPHIVPPDFTFKYNHAQIPLPPNFLPQHPWNNGEMTIRDEELMPWPRTPEGVQAYLAEYYRYITYLDSQIGRVLDALADSPYATNTIVVFSADSGVACGSHGLIGKQNCYEHSLRVPLIICGPGIPADERTAAMCYLFDVLPTLGKICGITAPKDSEGVEFSATLADPAKPARSSLIFAYKNVQRAYRDNRWKLIRYPQVDKTQLFDLRSDPKETKNLAYQPEYAAKVAELTTLLEKEMRSSGDIGVLKVAAPKPADWFPPASMNANKENNSNSATP
ncbi:MAG TPA: sulfatase-like hydrolase/transferase [bacterium]|nr:sulfatase-like hydrolase/transferase [bacterium]